MHLREISISDTSLIPFIEREMEDTAYHFENENINLAGTNINDEDCTPFVSDHEESVCKRLISENEFQTIDHEHFSEVTTFQEINSRSNEIEEDLNLIDNSSTSLCANELQENKESNKDFEDCRIVNSETFKESSSEVEFKPNLPYKRGVQLIRLQAVLDHSKEQPSRVECDVDLQKDNVAAVASEVSQGEIFKSGMNDLIETQAVVYSEPEYQFLTPKVPNVSQQPIFVSQNTDGSFQLGDTNFQALMQSESMNSGHTSTTTSHTPVIISNIFSSDFISPNTKEIPCQSSTVIKTPMWVMNSSSSSGTNNTNDDSTRVNSSSSFQYLHELSESVSSGHQSSTTASGSEIPEAQQMQRFLTADNQVVYGYKDSAGEFHFFCQALSDRESHNEKERKRRSRVSEACGTLRKIVPGLSDKTDKATVFEHAAAYLKFLRGKFSSQFDQSYCEKYFQERS